LVLINRIAVMLRVTRLTDYATLVLAALAREPGRIHAASELAERAQLELPTVAKVLKPLANAGLVQGFRGANGGYRLARAAESIALIDIVEAMEGRLGVTDCSGEHAGCEHESHCAVQAPWRRINDVIADALRSMNLAQMLPAPARPRAIPLALSES
jgi:FeS assembly SUF system regulator